MPEPVGWQVFVNSGEGVWLSEKQTWAVIEQLATDDRVARSIMSTSAETGAVGIVVTVDDLRRGFAIDQAVTVLCDALGAAGYALDRPDWIEALPLFEHENDDA